MILLIRRALASLDSRNRTFRSYFGPIGREHYPLLCPLAEVSAVNEAIETAVIPRKNPGAVGFHIGTAPAHRSAISTEKHVR